MRQEISEFLGYVGTERGYSPKTVAAYGYDLGKFSQYLAVESGFGDGGVQGIDQYTVKAFMSQLAEHGYKKANSTVARGRKLAVLKSFFKYMLSSDKIKTDPTANIKMPKTLEEIGIEARQTFLSSGGKEFHLLPCLNERDDWVEAIDEICTSHLQGWGTTVGSDTSRARAMAMGAKK